MPPRNGASSTRTVPSPARAAVTAAAMPAEPPPTTTRSASSTTGSSSSGTRTRAGGMLCLGLRLGEQAVEVGFLARRDPVVGGEAGVDRVGERLELLLGLRVEPAGDDLRPEPREGEGGRALASQAAREVEEPLGDRHRRVEPAARGEGPEARQPVAQPRRAELLGEDTHGIGEFPRRERGHLPSDGAMAPGLSTARAPW